MDEPKRGRGRPKGSKNRAAVEQIVEGIETHTEQVHTPGGTRASLEADRTRLLKSIADAAAVRCSSCDRGGDPKVEAALQSQLNGVNRMLLRISGETAPTDTNLIRSPQWGRLKARLFDCLAKKHPKAWADVLAIESDEAR